MSNLKNIRKARNLSQSQLADLAGINVRKIQDYEQGHRDINKASGDTLYQLAKVLNCTMEDLLEKSPCIHK